MTNKSSDSKLRGIVHNKFIANHHLIITITYKEIVPSTCNILAISTNSGAPFCKNLQIRYSCCYLEECQTIFWYKNMLKRKFVTTPES